MSGPRFWEFLKQKIEVWNPWSLAAVMRQGKRLLNDPRRLQGILMAELLTTLVDDLNNQHATAFSAAEVKTAFSNAIEAGHEAKLREMDRFVQEMVQVIVANGASEAGRILREQWANTQQEAAVSMTELYEKLAEDGFTPDETK